MILIPPQKPPKVGNAGMFHTVGMGKHLEQALPSVYTLQFLTGKVDNNNNNNNCE